MARARPLFQVSLIVDLSGASPYRMGTLGSALQARQACEEEGIAVELLVAIDDEDESGRAALSGARPDVWLNTAHTAFRSPYALPRAWLEKARGEYVTVLQSPDLIGRNWIPLALALLGSLSDEDAVKSVVHPGAVLFPDSGLKVFVPIERSVDAFTANSFGVLYLASHKQLMRSCPAEAASRDDCPIWKWNCDTAAAGLMHRFVPSTFHLVRTHDRSLRTGCFGSGPTCIPGTSPLYDASSPYVEVDIASQVGESPSVIAPQAGRELAEIAPDLLGVCSRPGWSGLTLPESAAEATRIFLEIKKRLTRVDLLFVHHYLSRGGSERETLLNIEALQSTLDDLNLAVLLTEMHESPWAGRVPKGVPVVEFGLLTRGLSSDERKVLLLRLLRQTAPRIINNVISPLCWEVFASHARSLAEQSKLIATSFCINKNDRGDPDCFAYSHLPLCLEHVSWVVSDNQTHLVELSRDIGVRRSLALQFPPSIPMVKPRRPNTNRSALSVIWAGRLTRQKRPDILSEVAAICQEIDFHVYGDLCAEGATLLEEIHRFSRLRNVTLHGRFEEFSEIRHDNGVLLYTSEWDGSPNIIIEAMAAGFPVIAPAVGGIPELVSDDTGYLVSGTEAVDEYVSFIRYIAADPRDAFNRAEKAQKFLESIHCPDLLGTKWLKLVSDCLDTSGGPRGITRNRETLSLVL